MALAINKQTNFFLGEVEDRIDLYRESEIYINSAKQITNLYITEPGTLRVMKETDIKVTYTSKIIGVRESSDGWRCILLTDKILTEDADGKLISEIAVSGIPERAKFELVRRIDLDEKSYIIFCNDQFYKCDRDGTNLATYDLLSTISKPFKDRTVIYADIYRVYRYSELKFLDTSGDALDYPEEDEYLTLQKIGTSIQDPAVKIVGNRLEVAEFAGEVSRIYFANQNDFISDGKKFSEITATNEVRDIYIPQPDETGLPTDWNDLKHGDLIINFFDSDPTEDFYLLFKAFKFDGLKTPATSTNNTHYTGLLPYYTTTTESAIGAGRLLQGDIINLQNSDIVTISSFQNRLILATTDTIYFSKTNDYDEFTNSIEVTDPFYIKLSLISNLAPNILNLYCSRGLFVMTDRGVQVINYQEYLTPGTVVVDTVSDMPCDEYGTCEMIDYSLFFLNQQNSLLSIQEDTETVAGRLYAFKVEKYKLYQEITYLSKIRIDNAWRLIVAEKDKIDLVRLYTENATNEFSCVTYEIPNDGFVHSIKDSFYTSNFRRDLIAKNKIESSIILHQPDTFTDVGGSLLNDLNTDVRKFVAKIVNEENKQVKHFHCDTEKTNQLSELVGTSSFYILDTGFTVDYGIPVKIELNDNSDGIVELQGLEYHFQVGSYV